MDVDSDNTLIYDPPPPVNVTPLKKKPGARKNKSVSKFVIQTIGLKAHNNSDMMQHIKKTRKRVFKCYLCKRKFSSTRGLNKHFKNEHYGLDCDICGREFNSHFLLRSTATSMALYPTWVSKCNVTYVDVMNSTNSFRIVYVLSMYIQENLTICTQERFE